MRVLVAGASGVLGRRIVRALVIRGHSVVALVRRESSVKTVTNLEAEGRVADLFDADAVARASSGCEVIVRAATAIPAKVRTGPKDWAMNDRIRREGTRTLTRAAAQVGARAYIQESIVWAVRAPDGGAFDETGLPAMGPILLSTLDAERIAREAGEESGFISTTLRFGSFYSADSWHTRFLAESLARGRPVLVGRGDPIWSFIHVDDAANAVVAASEAPQPGVWHVVDNRPAPLRDFLTELAKGIHADPPTRAPRWLARLAAGRYAADLLSSSFVTSNARFSRDFGWRPSLPTYVEGLAQVVREWRTEEFPPGTGHR
jgi:2-alkyl-3-oxoalkanoate reductase